MERRGSKGSNDPIEEYIKERAEREFREIMEGKKEVSNSTLLLLGMSRLFYRMDDIKKTIKSSMYPIWISIVAGIIAYIIINVIGI